MVKHSESAGIAPSEGKMWVKPATRHSDKLSNEDINQRYTKREWRIVTESNREQLPNFVEALKRSGWMNLRPFYQRRPRWDKKRQSRLIESFIMNIPVPPLFVYESDLAKYEVMDGQQRITAIRDFYSNELKLVGLQQWPELNGRTYSKLPSEIRKGLDRRSIAYTVLLKESAATSEEETLLRQLVFERLNTGGVKLSQQEVRNCLYQGDFNNLLVDLAKYKPFRMAWGLPAHSKGEEGGEAPDALLKNAIYLKMTDIEVILRFFALRHVENYQRGMQGFLDLYMVRSRVFTPDDIEFLRRQFVETIDLAVAIYGDYVFRPWLKEKNKWSKHPHVAFADAVMVSLWRLQHAGAILTRNKAIILERTRDLFNEFEGTTFTGAGNTKADVAERIDLVTTMMNAVVGK
jgi:hypothetical protein